ncbi:MAG: LPXTG cell wall anchor domain-containing protein [Actinomycetaceae bacterium]|nr:LPXTG cell wall anchor domain-containing protein [Actinomycetaceae bacterium]
MKKLISLLAVFALSLFGLAFGPIASDASAAPDDPVVFNDANLESLVKVELGLGDSEPVTEANIGGLTSLSVGSDSPVTDLTGLDKAVNLESLLIYEGDFEKLFLAPLSGLTNLTGVYLYSPSGFAWGKANDLPATVRYLSVTSAGLESFAGFPAHLDQLTYLDVYDNALSSWDGLPANLYSTVTSLNIANNAFTDVCADGSKLKDFTNLTILQAFFKSMFGDNNVSCLAGLPLRYLDLDDTGLSDASGLAPLALTDGLYLQWNALSDVSMLNVDGLTSSCYLDGQSVEMTAESASFRPLEIKGLGGASVPLALSADSTSVTADSDGSYTFNTTGASTAQFEWEQTLTTTGGAECTYSGTLTVNYVGTGVEPTEPGVEPTEPSSQPTGDATPTASASASTTPGGTAPSTQLPTTGVMAAPIAVVAMTLLFAGGILLSLRRRM